MFENKETLAVVLAIVVETAGVLVWAGAASERLKVVEARAASQAALAERLARMKAELEEAGEDLARLRGKLNGE